MSEKDLKHLVSLLGRIATEKVDPDSIDQFDPELADIVAPIFDRLCRTWFDMDVFGAENLPEGKALVVGNHNSGISFIEAVGLGSRMYLEGHMTEPWHSLAHDAMIDMPVVGPFLVKVGTVRAGHDTAAKVFSAGRKVMVFPGGNREAFRPWSQRNRIAFGGRKGFIRLALRHQVPIVPTVFYGGHNGFVVVCDNQRLAKWIGAKRFLRTETWPLVVGLPYGVSLGPFFHLPLPVKCSIQILEPISLEQYGTSAVDDPEVIQEIYDRVTQVMQRGMDDLRENSEGTLASLRRRVSHGVKARRKL